MGCSRFVGCVDFRWVLLGLQAALIFVGLFAVAVWRFRFAIRCESWFAGGVDDRWVVLGSFDCVDFRWVLLVSLAAPMSVGFFLARWLRLLTLGYAWRLLGTCALRRRSVRELVCKLR